MTWDLWRDEIAKACDGSHQTIESIEAQIAQGELIPLHTDNAFYLVQIVPYPTETACQIVWSAGVLEHVVHDLVHVHAWALQRGCTEILVEGRPGWKRALQGAGYVPWSITLRRPLYGSVH